MKSKTIYLLLFLIFILIIILLLKSNSQKSENNISTEQNTTPEITQTASFKLISTSISNQVTGITEPIKITFSQPVSSNFIYTLEPKSPVKISFGENPNEIIIDPVDAWGFDVNYTLKVSQSTTSTTNQILDRGYIYTFKTPPYSGI